MNTESKRKANAAYASRLLANGYKKRTFWLSPDDQRRLADIALDWERSDQQALSLALTLCPERYSDE